MNAPALTLVSHTLCPYVQRAAIVLAEKGAAFERRDVDLSNKPGWFLAVSPLGKTPVLLVGDTPVFESAVICDYLDETLAPALHPADALQRARHRGYVEFGSAVLNAIAAFYSAADDDALRLRHAGIVHHLATLEAALTEHNGPWFAGAHFSIVDAVFGPVFRYFDVFEAHTDFSFTTGLPTLHAWRQRLAARASVRGAVAPDYAQRLLAFLLQRDSALSRAITARR